MIPIIYDNPILSGNGYGRMADAISCTVTHEINGQYELAMEYPVTGQHYDRIEAGMVLFAAPDPVTAEQPFRIYRVTRPLNGVVTVYARHIAYDMSGISVLPFTASSLSEAFSLLPNQCVPSCPFTFTTTRSVASRIRTVTPMPLWSLLGGVAGSFLDVYGGEWDFNGLTASLPSSLGQDNGVSVRYGKNMTELEQDITVESTWAAVLPFWYNEETGQLVKTDQPVPVQGAFGSRVLTLDFSEEWEEAPTVAQLTARTEQYITANRIGEPQVAWKVNMAMLDQSEEYKGLAILERVQLGDTVTVVYEPYGIDIKARAVMIEYDVLAERYKSINLGRVKQNLAKIVASTPAEITAAVNAAKSALERAIDVSTDFITHGTGYMRFIYNDDKVLQEIVSLDNPDINLAQSVWRWNNGGFGHSSTGYAGPYTVAMTQDGAIVADCITAGTMSADRIAAGTITISKMDQAAQDEIAKGQEALDAADDAQATADGAATAAGNAKATADGAVANAAVVNILPTAYYREAVTSNPYVSNGITWTVNPDGSITATGTATAASYYAVSGSQTTEAVPVLRIDPDKKYTLSGVPAGGATSSYHAQLRVTPPGATPSTSSGTRYNDTGNGVTAPAGNAYAFVRLAISSGFNCGSGLTFYPMLEAGDTKHGYVSTHDGTGAVTAKAEAAQSTANGAAAAASAAQTKADAALVNSVAVFYRSTTNRPPSKPSAMVTSTDVDTDNTWTLAMPTPKKETYYYTCEQNTDGLGNVTWTDVRQLANATYVAGWASSRDATYIDGANIYTGSITAGQIAAGTITIQNMDSSAQGEIAKGQAALTAAGTAQSTADGAATAAATAQAKADSALVTTVPVYYRGSTAAEPSAPSAAVTSTAYNVDDAWSLQMPVPKNGATYYTCEQNTDGTGRVTFTPVRQLRNATYVAGWAMANNATYIDGASIFTGTVTADKIAANEVFTQKLTAHDFHISGGSVNIETTENTWDKITLKSTTISAEMSPGGLRVKNETFQAKPIIWNVSYTVGPSGPRSSRTEMNSLLLDGSWGIRARYTSEGLYFIDPSNKSSGGLYSTWVNPNSPTALYGYLDLSNTSTNASVYLDSGGLVFKNSSNAVTAAYNSAVESAEYTPSNDTLTFLSSSRVYCFKTGTHGNISVQINLQNGGDFAAGTEYPILTLPEQYRPAYKLRQMVPDASGATVCLISIDTTGAVTLYRYAASAAFGNGWIRAEIPVIFANP